MTNPNDKLRFEQEYADAAAQIALDTQNDKPKEPRVQKIATFLGGKKVSSMEMVTKRDYDALAEKLAEAESAVQANYERWQNICQKYLASEEQNQRLREALKRECCCQGEGDVCDACEALETEGEK